MYVDTCYIAKFYLNEPDSTRVRALVRHAGAIYSSFWAYAEFHAVIHRQVREGALPPGYAREVAAHFTAHVADGLWNLIPVTGSLLRRTSSLVVSAPVELFLRSGDAVHLTTAQDCGEREVWTSDRHMLAAAPYFGLTGRSV